MKSTCTRQRSVDNLGLQCYNKQLWPLNKWVTLVPVAGRFRENKSRHWSLLRSRCGGLEPFLAPQEMLEGLDLVCAWSLTGEEGRIPQILLPFFSLFLWWRTPFTCLIVMLRHPESEASNFWPAQENRPVFQGLYSSANERRSLW